jgi:hypothetical protein
VDEYFKKVDIFYLSDNLLSMKKLKCLIVPPSRKTTYFAQGFLLLLICSWIWFWTDLSPMVGTHQVANSWWECYSLYGLKLFYYKMEFVASLIFCFILFLILPMWIERFPLWGIWIALFSTVFFLVLALISRSFLLICY